MSLDAGALQRFWAKVDKSAGDDGCWLWGGIKNHDGYGRVSIKKRAFSAHRVAWGLVNGEIQRGFCVCHRCDVRHCVNPSHLFLGTHAENMADCSSKGRIVPSRGEANPSAKLTEAQVLDLRADRSAGMSYPKLSAKYGVARSTAYKVATGQKWAAQSNHAAPVRSSDRRPGGGVMRNPPADLAAMFTSIPSNPESTPEAPVAPQVPGLIIPHFRTSAPRTINNQPNKRRPNAPTAASPRFRNGPFTYGESLAITKALAKRARKAAAL